MMAADGRQTGNSLMDMKWSPMVVLSVLFHLAIFTVVLFVPEAMPTRRFESVVYSVNLVEMPTGTDLKTGRTATAKGTKGKTIVKRDSTAKRIKVQEKKKKPLVIAKRTVEPAKPKVEKPKLSASELIDKAVSRVEKKVEKAEEESHVDRAISRLETEVGDSNVLGSRGEKPMVGIPVQIYQMEVEERIKSNWSYPVALQSKKDLEAIVVVRVKRDGTLLKTEMVKGSSDPIFDESVIRAVKRSDPLPPFPEGYIKSYDEIEIKFNLRDLEGS